MEFITLPPEVTSALIHAGPGAHSLVAAASAWQELATSLEDTAQIYSSVLSSLTEGWHGASAAAPIAKAIAQTMFGQPAPMRSAALNAH